MWTWVGGDNQKKVDFYSLTIIQNIFDTPRMGNADGLSGCESENYF